MQQTNRVLGSLVWLVILGSAAVAGADPSNVAAWRRDGLQGQTLGWAAATAGDFNCDGIADLALGAPLASTSPTGAPLAFHQGWVGVWFGGVSLPPQPSEPPDWFVAGNGAAASQVSAELGEHVAAGDLDGDGCDDLLVSNRETQAGTPAAIRVFLGSASGPSTNFAWRRSVANVNSVNAGSLATGDVNGDGVLDAIVGLWDASSGGESSEGLVLVWLGGASFLDIADGPADPDWLAQSDQPGALLGASVASAGDFDGDGDDEILAGAPSFDGTLGGVSLGIAWMWKGAPGIESTADGTPGSAAWSMQLGGDAGAAVGQSVAGAGDVDGDGFADILVGAPNWDNPFDPDVDEGAVLVTRGRAIGPAPNTVDWSHLGTASNGGLGRSVATAGDVDGDGRADYLIGEPGFPIAAGFIGRAHLLLGRPTGEWPIGSPATDVVFSETGVPDTAIVGGFGQSVGTAGDWNGDGFSDVVIGAPAAEVTGGILSQDGSAFVYLGAGDTLAAASVPGLQGINPQDGLGLGMGYAGDINHDGCSDIVAGAPNFDNGQTDEGRVFVRYGIGDGCTSYNEIILPGDREGNQDGAGLGWSATGAGDVNGDGYADVIAGAPFHDGSVICGTFPIVFCPTPDSGRAYLFAGSANGMAYGPSVVLEGLEETGAQFGFSVASAGDVNGDGYGDVIVGAPYASNGRAFLYLGSGTGLSATYSWSASGSTPDARFGFSVAGVGDVNGDGFGDVLVGAENHGAGGAAFLYLGQPTQPGNPKGLGALPARTYTGAAGSSFGRTVAAAGDLNRDGKSDFAIGAPTRSLAGPFHEGEVTVYLGSTTNTLPTVPSATLVGDATSVDAHRFGSGIAGGGDVDGDGFGDLLVGDQWHVGPAGFAQGKAYIFHGGASGVATTPARTFEDCATSFCDFGRDVALAGDVDGDGFADALIGAFGDDAAGADTGSVYVHFGNNGSGMPLLPLQSRFSGDPAALLGAVTDFFFASMELHSPAGRTRVSLEFEMKPLGQDFDGEDILADSFFDNGLVDRGSMAPAIGVGEKVHWRARLRSLSPLFGTSRWVNLPGNAARELDVRMVPEPEALLGLAAGGTALALLARRRARAAAKAMRARV